LGIRRIPTNSLPERDFLVKLQLTVQERIRTQLAEALAQRVAEQRMKTDHHTMHLLTL